MIGETLVSPSRRGAEMPSPAIFHRDGISRRPRRLKSKADHTGYTIVPTASVFDAVKLMAEKNVGALVVPAASSGAIPASKPLKHRRLDPLSKERTMAEPLAVWHAEHVNFARLLDLLETQVVAFHSGERPNYNLMGDIVYYLRSFADCIHHPREDVAFARLARREPTMELVINRLLQEHRVISTAGEELFNRINEATEALEAAAATYLVYYRHHLAAEEREIMPRAAQLLTHEDWVAVAATVPAVSDPLFGNDVDARFRDLRKQIAMEVRVSRQE
jgi:hemerythrin-like domain-containing protein